MNQALNKAPLLIVLSGPTAVGKTKLSIKFAEQLGADIISADSRQIYKELEIGTAKPSKEQLERVPHHFIDHASIEDTYSAGRYEREVLAFLSEYFKQKNVGILTGGTGFYIQAVLEGLDSFPKISDRVKEEVAIDLREKGMDHLKSELKDKDPATYREIDLDNPRRISRAIEVIRESGRAFSEFKGRRDAKRQFSTLKILLEREREELYHRINQRVDKMVEEGLEEEARSLHSQAHLVALQTVGYQEWFDHFDGKIDRTTAIEKIKQHTRNYAKRQLTWFRKKEGWHKFHADAHEEVITFVRNQLNQP